MGLEGAILIPILIMGCAAIIYFGLNHVREQKARRERGLGPTGPPDGATR